MESARQSPKPSLERVVITGASSGIGRAIAKKLSRRDTLIVNIDINDGADAAADCVGDFETVRADLGDAAAVDDAFSEIDRIFSGEPPQLLVCCAALSRGASFLEVSQDDLDRMLNINVKGTFNSCQQAARRMRIGDAGHIVVITSICAVQGWADESVYCVTKGAQQSMVQALAVELAPFNILVNAVAPGIIEQTGDAMAKTRMDPEVRRHDLERTSLDRFGTPDEVAEAVHYLSTVSWMTGQTLILDGGFMSSGLNYFGHARTGLQNQMKKKDL